jgi:ABC-2 type transport system permease protein/oleandomycin transport system permease protein
MLGIAVIIITVGLLVGLRPDSVLGTLAAIGLMALFGFAFSWISAWIGLSVKDVETANLAGFVWLFPLTFASSAFVPVESMPSWLETFAELNPFTVVVDAMRALWLGAPAGSSVWGAFAWTFALLLVFAPLAVARYRTAASR